jgi:hypothetical protein
MLSDLEVPYIEASCFVTLQQAGLVTPAVTGHTNAQF